MPESDQPPEPSTGIEEFSGAIGLLEPVTRQNVVLAALCAVYAGRDGEESRANLRRWVGELRLSDVDALFRDREERTTPEWRLVMVMRQLAVRGMDLVPHNLTEELRNDRHDDRLRPRMYRARRLRERGGNEPNGDAATLAQAHAKVVAARELLARGAIGDPARVGSELALAPVNYHGAVRAASTALDREDARAKLRLARHERRVAMGIRAGEVGVGVSTVAATGWLFATLPPAQALAWSIATLAPNAGTVVKEFLRPTRLMDTVDGAVNANYEAGRAKQQHQRAWQDFRRHSTRVGEPRRR